MTIRHTRLTDSAVSTASEVHFGCHANVYLCSKFKYQYLALNVKSFLHLLTIIDIFESS